MICRESGKKEWKVYQYFCHSNMIRWLFVSVVCTFQFCLLLWKLYFGRFLFISITSTYTWQFKFYDWQFERVKILTYDILTQWRLSNVYHYGWLIIFCLYSRWFQISWHISGSKVTFATKRNVEVNDRTYRIIHLGLCLSLLIVSFRPENFNWTDQREF